MALPALVPLNAAPAQPDFHTNGDFNSARIGTPQAATTLLEVLAWHVHAHPEQTQVVVLRDDSEQTRG